MTARTHPEQPRFANEAERLVFERVRDALPGDAIVVANQVVLTEEKDHEADLVVLLPGEGVVVLEVKGGSVHYDGRWHQSGGQGTHLIDPVEQAAGNKYALRRFVDEDPRWGTRGRVAWAHGVVVPYSSFPADFASPELDRSGLHDRDDLDDLATRLVEHARAQRQGDRPPTHDDLEVIVAALAGRGHTGHDPAAVARERQSEADRLTSEQAALLQVTRLLHRVEVRGGAGSGKTVMALAQARELTRGRADRPAQRVALVCYSYGLAVHFARVVETWPRNQRPAFVGTYEDLARVWGVTEFGDRDNSPFWEEELPQVMAELAAELPPGKRFDSFVVDESQDFADSWWTPLLRGMKDEETGGLYVYSDEHQRIFARFGKPPVPLVPLVLDHNLRNTRQIHSAFSPLAPTRMSSRGGDGADVAFVPWSPDQGEGVADAAVDLLLDAGWSPGQVALLSTSRRHSVQLSEVERLGQVGYMKTWWDDDEVFYGHVLGCKGLERAAVVLWVNDEKVGDRSRERLYVGMSRATDQLIVVGDPALVREMGGPEVAKRLGLG